MPRYSTALRNTVVNHAASQFNGGRLRIYTGSEPSSADSAPTGTLLVEITLPNPAFGSASSGTANSSGTWSATASASGTAGYFRLVDSGGTVVLQGPVQQGTSAVNGVLTLNNTSIATGQTVTITSFSLSHPDVI